MSEEFYIVWVKSRDRVSGNTNNFTVDIQNCVPDMNKKFKIQLLKGFINRKAYGDGTHYAFGDLQYGGYIEIILNLNSSYNFATSTPTNGMIIGIVENNNLNALDATVDYINHSTLEINEQPSIIITRLQRFLNITYYNYDYTNNYVLLLNSDGSAIKESVLCLKITPLE